MSSGSSELTKSKYFNTGKKSTSGRPSTRASHSDHTENTSSNQETSGNISLGDNDSSATLRRLEKRLEKIEVAVDSVVKTEDLKTIVSAMIKDVMKHQREEFELLLERSEERQKKEISKLRGKIDDLSVENDNLRELIAEKRFELSEAQKMAISAIQKADEARKWANYNEQYSCKNNVKIFGLRESHDEDTESEVIKFLQKEGDTTIRPEEIVAVHRIPGRDNQPRPILLKLKNSAIKGRVIRQRSEIKKKKLGVRLADDVTYENTKLMERLSDHELIESTWFFNGSVYGKVNGTGRKVKFDINDEVEDKIRKSRSSRKVINLQTFPSSCEPEVNIFLQMAEFIILRNRDLRYIYSGRSVITPPSVRKSYITNIPHPELKKSILNFAEYARQADRDYRYVPCAPAFRFYSKQDLDEVVERLYSAGKRESRSARSLEVSKSKNKVLLPKRRRMTPEMAEDTFRRLMQPTHMSSLKVRVPPPKFKPTFTRSLTM